MVVCQSWAVSREVRGVICFKCLYIAPRNLVTITIKESVIRLMSLIGEKKLNAPDAGRCKDLSMIALHCTHTHIEWCVCVPTQMHAAYGYVRSCLHQSFAMNTD